jgi:hypothetical protein
MSNDRKAGKKDVKKRLPSSYVRHLLAIGLIASLAFVVYSNTFYVPFHFDDRPNILENPNIQIKVFTWDRLENFVKNTYAISIRVFSYFTLALNYHFGEFNVFGYHLVNFLIHVATGIFLYWFLILTLNLPSLQERYGPISYKLALFTALIFICHPIQTQSVTYIVQRMTSMAGMFYLLSMILYVKGRLSGGKARFLYLGGAVMTWLLGVFSKENVAILPLFILLYEFYFLQNLTVTQTGKKILLVLLVSVVLIVTAGFLLWGGRYFNLILEGYKIREFTLEQRLLTQSRVVLYYLTLLVYPHPSRLNLDYDFPVSRTIVDPPTTLLSILIIIALIGYSIWVAKKRPLLSYFTLWYFGNLVIESSIFPLEMVYEHRLYLPAVGPFILFSLLVIKGIEKLRARFPDVMNRTPASSSPHSSPQRLPAGPGPDSGRGRQGERGGRYDSQPKGGEGSRRR